MRIERDGDKTTLFAKGKIFAVNAPLFANDMEKAIEGTTELTLDCTDLEYISSSGLRVVLLAVKTMDGKGTIRITNVSEDVYEVLEATGFTGVADVEIKAE